MTAAATVHTIEFTEEDLTPTGDYSSFKPGEYRGVLESVEDVVAKKTDNVGWKWKFTVEGLTFDIVTWLKGKALWKLQEVVSGLGGELTPGALTVDPSMYIGATAGVKIDKDANNTQYPDRLVIVRVFPLPDNEGSIFAIPEL